MIFIIKLINILLVDINKNFLITNINYIFFKIIYIISLIFNFLLLLILI